ncbi:MAG: M14 family metallopeptidase [Draconibacterium sp.]|nr:M14 family metallopeptidase [Draconibacterium sp.]
MKKFLKILVLVIVLLVAGVLGYTYISFNYYAPNDPEIEVDPSSQQYFQDSYVECRSAFRFQANKLSTKIDSVQIFSRIVPSKTDDDLTLDFCYVPAQKETKKLLILTSGTHGVEGFVGSAVQKMFMNEVLTVEMLDNVGILFVHGINPFGFKYVRRVTENNVDFNRNCDTNKSLFSSKNSGYNDLYTMLNPEGKVNTKSLKNKFFLVVAIDKLLQESMASLRQAILQGQYEHKKGLYFGGDNFEPQLAILGEVFKKISLDYESVFNIDLHTGYGERGTCHLFPNPIDDSKVKSTLENIFDGYQINWGDSDDFYTINGSFTDYIGKLLSDKFYLPMLFEYGTLNSQTTIGSVKSLHNMVLENQGAQFGYKSTSDSLKVKHSFMEMYNPSSEKWRTKIMIDSKAILIQAMKNYDDL